jgi:ATP-dependent RNA helicase HelY
VEAFTRMRIPKSFNGRNPQSRRDLASALRARTQGFTPPPRPVGTGRGGAGGDPQEREGEREISRLRAELRAHPCHGCPDREDHARWAERYHKLDRDTRTLQRRIEQRTNTIARQFDRVCEVLTALGYLENDEVTETAPG